MEPLVFVEYLVEDHHWEGVGPTPRLPGDPHPPRGDPRPRDQGSQASPDQEPAQNLEKRSCIAKKLYILEDNTSAEN